MVNYNHNLTKLQHTRYIHVLCITVKPRIRKLPDVSNQKESSSLGDIASACFYPRYLKLSISKNPNFVSLGARDRDSQIFRGTVY